MTSPTTLKAPLPPLRHHSRLPTLGYTVWWSLAGLRVPHELLEERLTEAGFSAYLPAAPSYQKALRRALQAWIRQQLGPAARQANELLVRTIRQPRTRQVLFALVAENQDIAALGLSYATALRLLLDKESGGLLITTEARGMLELASDQLAVAAGTVSAAEAEAQAVAQALLPLWQRYRSLHMSADLASMVREILCGEVVQPARRRTSQPKPGLGAVSVRSGGGLYFVPAMHRAALERLADLIEQLPRGSGHEPYVVIQPVLDEAQAKRQLARAAHEGFLDEIAALRSDLERLQSAQASAPQTIAARLASYRHTVAKVDTYADLLGLQRERLVQGLEALKAQARELLLEPETAANPTEPT